MTSKPEAPQSKGTTPGTTSKPHSPKTVINNGRPFPLPQRPLSTDPSSRQILTFKSRPQAQEETKEIFLPGGTASSSTQPKRQIISESSSRPPKRLKGDGDTEPSLLRRLGSTVERKEPRMPPSNDNPPHSVAQVLNPPPAGYSIKGAAKMARSLPTPVSRDSAQAPSFSLLDRLEGNSTHDDRTSGGWSRKSRGRS